MSLIKWWPAAALGAAAVMLLWRPWIAPPIAPVAPLPVPPAQAKPAVPPPAPTAPAALRLRFHPQLEQPLVYQFEMQASSEADYNFLISAIGKQALNSRQTPQEAQPAQWQRIELSTHGELALKYYRHPLKTDVWQVAGFLMELDYKINGKIPAYMDSLRYPFVFLMDERGQFSRFDFALGMQEESRQFIQSLLNSLQIVLSEQASPAWRSDESDTLGDYTGEYRILSGGTSLSVEKHKTAYRHSRFLGMFQQQIFPGLENRIDQSRYQASLLLQDSGALSVAKDWLQSLSGEEAVTFLANGHAHGKTSNQFKLERIQKDVHDLFPATFADVLAGLRGQQYLNSKYYATDERLNQMGEGLDLNGALDKYLELMKQLAQPNAGRLPERFLVNYLRAHPQASFELVDALDRDTQRQRFDEKTQLILWRLLTEAGHIEAQQAVTQVLSDPRFQPITRYRALLYVSDFENPQTATAEALWHFYQETTAAQQAQNLLNLEIDPDLAQQSAGWRNMSLLAYGALGNTNKENADTRAAVTTQLQTYLHDTQNTADAQSVALQAIGNTANPALLKDVVPYLSATDEAVRISGYQALRQMPSADAALALTRQYASEASPKVRVKALETLADMPTTGQALNWARQNLPRVEEARGQAVLVNLLGSTLQTYPENAAALRQLLEKSQDNQVKMRIYRYLTPQAGQ